MNTTTPPTQPAGAGSKKAKPGKGKAKVNPTQKVGAAPVAGAKATVSVPGPGGLKTPATPASNTGKAAVGTATNAPSSKQQKPPSAGAAVAPVKPIPSPWSVVTQTREELMKILRHNDATQAQKSDVANLCQRSKLLPSTLQATLMRFHNTEPVTVSGPAQQAVASAYGQRTRMKESGDFTTHPKAQMSRKLVERCLMMCLVGDIDSGTLRFVDYYGSSRLHKRYTASCWPRRPVVPMVRHAPILVPKDTMTQEDLVPYKSKQGDLPIFEDVYISPEKVASVFEKHGFERGYVIMCEHDSRFLAGTAFEGEGVWYNNDGSLVQYSAAGETAWMPTPFCDSWFSKQFIIHNGKALTWNIHRRVLDYALITVRYTAIPKFLPKELPRPFTSGGLVIKKTISRADMTWYDWASMHFNGIEEKELLCFWPAIDLHRAKMTGKSRVGHQIAQITSEVETLVSGKDYRMLWSLGLFDKARVVADTVYYLAWDGIHRDCDLAENALVRFGGLAERFKKTKMRPVHVDPVMSTIQKICLAAGALGVLCLTIVDWTRMRSGGYSVIAVVLKIFRFLSSFSKLTVTTDAPVICQTTRLMKEYKASQLEFLERFMPSTQRSPILRYLPMVGEVFVKACEAGQPWPFLSAAVYEELIKLVVPPELFGAWEALVMVMPAILRSLPAEQPLSPAHYFGALWFKMAMHFFMSRSDHLGNRMLRHGGWNMLLMPHVPLKVGGAIMFLGSFRGEYGPKVVDVFPRWVTYPISLIAFHRVCMMASYPTSDPAFDEGYESATLLKADEHPPIVKLAPGACLPANRHFPGYEVYADAFGVARNVYDGREPTTFVYELLTTTAQFHRPAGVFHFLRAYSTRNLSRASISLTCEIEGEKCRFNDARHGRKTNCPLSARWARSQRLMECEISKTLTLLRGSRKKRDAWARGMTGAMKKNRALEANELRSEGIVLPKSDAFLKGDEVLYPRPDGLKGRVVKAIHPTVQSDASVEILRAMTLLKRCFSVGVTHRINGWEYQFSVGSGKTSSDLSEWFDRSLHWVRMADARCAAIFAGDDLYIITRVDGKVLIVENDMSKMDRTNGVHALAAEARVLELFGTPKVTINLLFKAMESTAVYIEKYLDYKLKCVMPSQRATGAADTTFGNTYVAKISTLDFLSCHSPTEKSWLAYAESILKLGFEGKTQVMDFGYQGTFLKGWWVPTVDREQHETIWLPLPSQVLKLGKILTNPTTIFRGSTEAQAWARAATAIAKGVGVVPEEYPILGPFLKKMRELSDIDVEEYREQDHKIKIDTDSKIDRQAAIAMYSARYKLDEEQILSVEKLIVNAPFPARLSHVVFDIIAAKDYG